MTPDEAVKEWARRQLTKWGYSAKEIISVDFGMGDNGGCSTCGYSYAGVEIGWKQNNGHMKYDVAEPEGGLMQMFAEVHQILQGN